MHRAEARRRSLAAEHGSPDLQRREQQCQQKSDHGDNDATCDHHNHRATAIGVPLQRIVFGARTIDTDPPMTRRLHDPQDHAERGDDYAQTDNGRWDAPGTRHRESEDGYKAGEGENVLATVTRKVI